jgi:hypothetical protein
VNLNDQRLFQFNLYQPYLQGNVNYTSKGSFVPCGGAVNCTYKEITKFNQPGVKGRSPYAPYKHMRLRFMAVGRVEC